MRILTWNIQATKGCDNRFDITRIVDHIKRYADLDVICLQELSAHISVLNSDDQPALFSAQFPDYEATWAPGFSVPTEDGGRSEFGNLTLVKRSLLRWARVHALPSPLVSELQIPRTMVETAIQKNDFVVTVFNAHLAFHSTVERVEQIQALTQLRNKIMLSAQSSKASDAWGPYTFSNDSQAVILCGDMNVDSDSSEFNTFITDQQWVDCWSVQAQQSLGHRQPTCGCFDRVQWPQGPHVRDYFLATKNIATQTQLVEVDVETDASDHQPVLLEIAL